VGYDLHITRRKQWSATGHDISAEEWLAYVERDGELRLRPEDGPHVAIWSGPSELDDPWLDWSDGQIETKNPDPALIDKMVTIARAFGATVQGDDGEIYDSGASPGRQPRRSVAERVGAWFARLRSRPLAPAVQTPLPFAVGDRVRDPWGNAHTVIRIDPAAEHGLGMIWTRRDDGNELGFMMIAHGLTLDTPRDAP
jgi:hypothetical protein